MPNNLLFESVVSKMFFYRHIRKISHAYGGRDFYGSKYLSPFYRG